MTDPPSISRFHPRIRSDPQTWPVFSVDAPVVFL